MFNKHKINFCKYLSGVLLLLIFSCNKDNSRPAPDVSGINVDIEIQRFEIDLFNADTINWDQAVRHLETSYPVFFECFVQDIMELGTVSDTNPFYKDNLRRLIKYGGIEAAYDSTMLEYPDVDNIEKELEQAFKFYKYYYPENYIPNLVTFVSEYTYGIVSCGDSVIGIGLDLFLGDDYSFYAPVGIPQFLIPKFKEEYIAPNVIKVLAQHNHSTQPAENTLLAQMIHNGKILYFVDMMMPKVEDYRKVGFTKEQTDWIRKNEGEVWAFFMGEGLLYETSRIKYNKYISEGPGIPGLPMDAPGNIGTYIGWQIVRQYMNKYQNISFDELMERQNAQEILQKSGYKPRR